MSLLRLKVALVLVIVFLLPLGCLPPDALFQLDLLGAVSVSTFINAIVIGTLLIWLFLSRVSTLAFMHMLAVWLMMAWAPWVRFLTREINNSFYGWHSDSSVLTGNLVVLLWSLTFAVAYRIFQVRLRKRPPYEPKVLTSTGIRLQVLLAIISLGYIIIRTDLGVFTRWAFDQAFATESTVEGLLVQFPVRMASIYALSALLFKLRSRQQGGIAWIWTTLGAALLGLLTMIINSPVAGSRFFTGSVLLGWLYSLVLYRSRECIFPLFIVIIIGAFGFLPLDFGRADTGVRDAWESIEVNLERNFTTDYFRAYEAIPGTIDYVEEFGHTSFSQLSGNLLFFIPRSVWPSKPEGSGHLIGVQYGMKFTNIATPLPAEGYINFGFPGVAVLAILFALVVAKLDSLNERATSEKGVPVYQVFFGFLLGNMLFITRGDLLSPLAYTVSMCLGGIVLLLTAKRGDAPAPPRTEQPLVNTAPPGLAR